MRRRLRSISERDWRAIDRGFALLLAAVAVVDLSTSSKVDGPLWLNLAIMVGIALTFAWRRSHPWVPLAATLTGLTVMALWLTEPPDTFVAVLLLVSLGYTVGRHMQGRPSFYALGIGAGVIVLLSIIFDPGDIFFPLTFFWILPWLAGRTIRNHTMLARELSEKAERARHAREEDERRAIARERNRIARELHDVLARRARATGLRVELRVSGDPVALPAGIDLAAYRIVQEALTNAIKHAASARAGVTIAYEPNEVALTIEDDGEGPRDGFDLERRAAATASWACANAPPSTAGSSRPAGAAAVGFAVRARLPTRPLVPGAELKGAGTGKVPA